MDNADERGLEEGDSDVTDAAARCGGTYKGTVFAAGGAENPAVVLSAADAPWPDIAFAGSQLSTLGPTGLGATGGGS